MTDAIARMERNQSEANKPGAGERRAAAIAREVGAVGEVGWLLARRSAVLAGRMEQLAGRDEVMVAANVAAARAAFDEDRRAEVAGWAAALDGDDPEPIAAALAGLELSGTGLDVLHRAWGRVRAGLGSDDPARAADAATRARRYLDAGGTRPTAGGGDLARRVAAEMTRLRAEDDRTRVALDRLADDLRHEATMAATFDVSPAAILARRHEAAAERGFYRALKMIREIRRDAGPAPAPVAAVAAPAPRPAPVPIPQPTRSPAPSVALGSFCAEPAAALGSFRTGQGPILAPAPAPRETALGSSCIGAGPAGKRR